MVTASRFFFTGKQALDALDLDVAGISASPGRILCDPGWTVDAAIAGVAALDEGRRGSQLSAQSADDTFSCDDKEDDQMWWAALLTSNPFGVDDRVGWTQIHVAVDTAVDIDEGVFAQAFCPHLRH